MIWRIRSRAARLLTAAGLLIVNASLQWGAFAQEQPAPLPTTISAQKMSLPDGFQATLFAGEPEIVQPISFTFDDRGRLWVVECLTYPKWITDGSEGPDRIVILEDADGDGRFDSRKVFYDKGTNYTSVALGFGGAWVCATPHLLFIPDRNGDDVPDGPPEIVLDGWDLNARHNVFNGLTWGPDGWLYGLNGILSNSKIGRPGIPDDQRVSMNCGVWRIHPVSRQVEAVAWGTTNPWGLDFDDFGRMFITNCVIEHLFHVVPGAHFKRMFGQDVNPYSYGLLESCADHIHWGGGDWQDSRGGHGVHDKPGGGHAHVGAMLYLGDNWPQSYRGGLFTCNVHGNRVNHDTIEPLGSGVVARHAPDFLMANDTWFRGLELKYGPDGGVFITDWSDTGECHDYDDIHRENGRIYKVTYGRTTQKPVNVAALSDADLVKLQLHPNDWHVQHSRRVMQERAAAGVLSKETRPLLLEILKKNGDVTRRLRALWALHVIGGVDEPLVSELLTDTSEHVRSWAIRLELEDKTASAKILGRLAAMAESDPSPVVRLELASVLQRLPLESRPAIAQALVAHAEDAGDPNLPLMVWYGVEGLVPASTPRSVELLASSHLPAVRENIARRIASEVKNEEASALGPLIEFLGRADDAAVERDVLRGIGRGVEGRRSLSMPEAWADVYRKLADSSDAEVRGKAMLLAVLSGDEQAIVSLRKRATDPSVDAPARRQALEALLTKLDGALLPLLESLLDDTAMRGAALRGLAAFNDTSIPKMVLGRYGTFSEAEKIDAVNALASRPAYAVPLLDAIGEGTVPSRDLPAFTVRQLAALNNGEINERIEKFWGSIRETSQDKQALIAEYKSLMTAEVMQQADRSNGRAVFNRTCAGCHTLFGAGRKVGPDLTGSQRRNLDYVLQNLVDPNAIVGRDYKVTVIATAEGRVMTGVISSENNNGVVMETANERIVIPLDEIEIRKELPQSMMPEGMLPKLTREELRDLLSYLAADGQVPSGKGIGSSE